MGEGWQYRKSIHCAGTSGDSEIARACKAMNVAFVDLQPSIASEPAESLWVHAVDLHPNARAHALFATRLRAPVAALFQ